MEVNSSNYQKLAERTSATATPEGCAAIRERMSDDGAIRLLHAALGLGTEAGEFQDAVKKWLFYGSKHPLTFSNMREEMGDVLWYVAEAINALGATFDEAMSTNVRKLAERYGDKFSEFRALNRDLEAEQRILSKAEVDSLEAGLADERARLESEVGTASRDVKRDSNYKTEEATSLADIQQQLIDARQKDHEMADWARMYGQRLIDKCIALELTNKTLALDVRDAHSELSAAIDKQT